MHHDKVAESFNLEIEMAVASVPEHGSVRTCIRHPVDHTQKIQPRRSERCNMNNPSCRSPTNSSSKACTKLLETPYL